MNRTGEVPSGAVRVLFVMAVVQKCGVAGVGRVCDGRDTEW